MDTKNNQLGVVDFQVHSAATAQPYEGEEYELPTNQDINHAQTMVTEPRAVLAKMEGRKEDAESWFQHATKVEENASFVLGPHTAVKPSQEMYGEWLLAMNRGGYALIPFNKALERAPKRILS